MNIQILDCTLREAPLRKLDWGDRVIRKIVNGLELSKVDIIELGFLKNEPYLFGSSAFQKVEQIKSYIQNKNKTKFVALVDYGRYNVKYLSKNDGSSIDAIRICFKHNEIDSVLDFANEVRNKGYLVCIQHVDTMGYKDEEIDAFIDKINEFKPYSYSIVDTFGAMYPEELDHYIGIVAKKLDDDITLGFHAHNNLLLADANAQFFINKLHNKRNIIIDSSLIGCGRGAGNAHTELLVQYLNRFYNANYNLDEILDLVDIVEASTKDKASWGYSAPYFISGIYNSHTFNVNHLLKRHNLKSKDLRAIIERLDNNQKKVYDFALLEKIYVEYFDNHIDDSSAMDFLKKHFNNKSVLLIGPGKSVNGYLGSEILAGFDKENTIAVGVNNIIRGYKLDYVFYSSCVRYNNLQYQDYVEAGFPSLLLTSNVKNKASKGEYLFDYKSLIKYGWVNLDSSLILLLRLLTKFSVTTIYIVGIDGYSDSNSSFYSEELNRNLDHDSIKQINDDNLSMLQDFKKEHPLVKVNFLTNSIYQKVFENE